MDTKEKQVNVRTDNNTSTAGHPASTSLSNNKERNESMTNSQRPFFLFCPALFLRDKHTSEQKFALGSLSTSLIHSHSAVFPFLSELLI